MDILTHSLSGVAVGTVLASFSHRGAVDKSKIILLSGIAGALPDIDAISLWSGFDATLGQYFALAEKGREIYSAKFWYSHHAFMHSIMAALLFAGLLGLCSDAIARMRCRSTGIFHTFKSQKLMLISFILAFLLHLLEDMPTPAATWGGVNLFFPAKNYMGGTGDIWWWNNYDIFLIVLVVTTINLFLLILNKCVRFSVAKLTVSVFLFGAIMAIYQIKTRNYDFSYTGYSTQYQTFEQQSKDLQKSILGERLYNIMNAIDQKLPIYF